MYVYGTCLLPFADEGVGLATRAVVPLVIQVFMDLHTILSTPEVIGLARGPIK